MIIPCWLLLSAGGCAYFPETRHRDVLHNPFPQLKRVAVLPFYNQSSQPSIDSDRVAEAYYAALQAVPGFEVLPVGVAKAQWLQFAMNYGEPISGQDFQRLAQAMGVEAVVVGSVTDFDPYYPPRLAMTVHWYAANEGFHPIPPGYGLPWGTDAQQQIPRRITREAEFELARSQLATQSPLAPLASNQVMAASGGQQLEPDPQPFEQELEFQLALDPAMPPDWPDPTDLIPDPPAVERPLAEVSHEPVITHTRLYRGDDPYFTNRLADYVETGDDARPGGWQDYLKRSDDFIRFCCHLHITEMLESRGGSEPSELILRWPLSRY